MAMNRLVSDQWVDALNNGIEKRLKEGDFERAESGISLFERMMNSEATMTIQQTQYHRMYGNCAHSDPGMRWEQLSIRCRWTSNAVLQRSGVPDCFDAITTGWSPEARKVFVFVVMKDGKAITFEDDEMMYPSDTLVAQLKLLENA